MSDYVSILAVALFAIALLGTLFLSHSFQREERSAHDDIADLTLNAVFIAIIMIMTFVPNMGFLAITPFVSLTLLHLPVLLGAMLGGWKKGAILGFVFGLASYMQALSSSGFNALFAYPWVAIPPRLLFGLFSGIVFSLIGKFAKSKRKGIYLAVACAVLTAVHTGLVFLDLYVCYPDTIVGLFSSSSPAAAGTALTFTLIIVFGMLGEMALAAFVVPPLYFAVTKVMPRLGKKKKHALR